MKMMQKIAAAALAVAVLAGSTACTGDVSWAMKNDALTVPIGAYIYSLRSAYDNAKKQVEDSTKPVLEQQIDGKDAETWIKETAVNSVKRVMVADAKMRELGLSLTADEKKQVESATNSNWSYYSKTWEGYGVAKSSYQMVNAEYSMKYAKVLYTIYGKGGSKEISEADLKAAFEKDYTDLQLIQKSYFDMTTYQSLSEEDQKKYKEKFEGYAKEINEGKKTLAEVAEAYEKDEELTSSPLQNSTLPIDETSMSDSFKKSVKEMKVGEARVIEEEGSYLVLAIKNDITKKTSEYVGSENGRNDLISYIKGEEFADQFEKDVEAFTDYTVNQPALDGQNKKIQQFAKEDAAKASSSSGSSSSASSSSSGKEESSSGAGSSSK